MLKNGKKTCKKLPMLAFFAIFRPLTGSKTLQKLFFLVEEVLTFNLVAHMWKSIKNWLQEWLFNIYKWKWGRSRWIAYFENYLQKWLGDKVWGISHKISHRISHKIFCRISPKISHRFSCKISFRISLKISWEFPPRFSAIFPAEMLCLNPTCVNKFF